MTTRQTVLLSMAIIGLFSFLLVIIFGDKGLADFHLLRLERDRLVESNETLVRENLSLYQQKVRLEKDPLYIEHVAREELGLVYAHDLVFIAPSDKPVGAD
ncbi:MAG: septum formation initiator family protein [Desulfobacterales bacterium]|nr:septum formation initiator family protein [Desulfobacterales bacterium]